MGIGIMIVLARWKIGSKGYKSFILYYYQINIKFSFQAYNIVYVIC